MKKTGLTLLAALLCAAAIAQPKEVHIISVNDMHAKIENFPKFAAIVDSLRAVYPDLLILSAGDNRTGDPLNDLYEIPAYPMVALMNQVGFDASTLGNHEFDSNPYGLSRLISLSNFPYICANVHPYPKYGIHLSPCKIFDLDGTKVGIVGAVALGTSGHPDTHPDNVVDIDFTPVTETISEYAWLRADCDVVIALTHIGYEDDVALSAEIPWVDVIVGGHSHTQIDGGEMHNGILITQNLNRLPCLTHTTITVNNGKVTGKKAENIDVENYPRENKIVAEMVRFFSDNPAFQRVLCQFTKPVSTYEELGCMMTDAWRAETGADVAFTNYGGVRYDTLPAGPFTVSDALKLDPFGNQTVELKLTGKELKDMLISCYVNDQDRFPVVSGILVKVFKDKKNPVKIKDITITNPDGSKFDLKKTYTVVTNSYSAVICNSPRQDPGRELNKQTVAFIQDYLEHQGSVDYSGVTRVSYAEK